MNIICVTNRKAVSGDFLASLERIAAYRPTGIWLREKDLSLSEYTALAVSCQAICRSYGVRLLVHHISVADQLKCGLHLPCQTYLKYASSLPPCFISVSVHSAEEAQIVDKFPVSMLVAGHIFPTDCKKGLAPRGLPFLQEVCASSQVPVYAIGGITPQNATSVLASGASGICLMSAPMKNPDCLSSFGLSKGMLQKDF